ncbi:hypothetical protein [Streptomyces sp. NPDC051576]|uniref:hypothetical protein n=1 Tax=Streptomyces sp. NPDC051576 TaxID=3155803 RepID=UPI00343290E2
MADSTPHAPGGPDPSPQNGPTPARRAEVGDGQIRLQIWRWVLAPRTTWQARRLAAEFGPGMDTRTAWVMARLARHPEERLYAMRHLNGENDD